MRKNGLPSFSYQTRQTLIRTLGCSWRAGASMPVSGFTALFPDGWHDITLEVSWEPTGPGCWYISTPGFSDICPIGLFVKV